MPHEDVSPPAAWAQAVADELASLAREVAAGRRSMAAAVKRVDRIAIALELRRRGVVAP